MELTSDINRMLDQSRRFDLMKRDVTVAVKDVVFLPDGRAAIPELGTSPTVNSVDIGRFQPTQDLADDLFGQQTASLPPLLAPVLRAPGIEIVKDEPYWPALKISPLARRQLVSKLVGDWGLKYLTNDKVSDQLFTENMRYWQRKYDGRTKNWFVRSYVPTADAYDPDEMVQPEIRAVLRGGYPDFTNSQILYLMTQFSDLFSQDPLSIKSYIMHDRIYLRLEFKSGQGDEYSRLAFLSSSETGTGSVSCKAGLKRISCNNSLKIVEGWSQTHNKLFGESDSWKAAEHFARELSVELPRIFSYADKALEQIGVLRQHPVNDPADVIDAICRARGIAHSQTNVRKALVAGSELQSRTSRHEDRYTPVFDDVVENTVGATEEHIVRAFSALPKLAGLSVDQVAKAEETAGILLQPGAFADLVEKGRRLRDKLEDNGKDTLDEYAGLFRQRESVNAELGPEFSAVTF